MSLLWLEFDTTHRIWMHCYGKAMCGHNTNGSVGLHKHTHKLKQQFSLADQRLVKTVMIHFCNFPLLLVLLRLKILVLQKLLLLR